MRISQMTIWWENVEEPHLTPYTKINPIWIKYFIKKIKQ